MMIAVCACSSTTEQNRNKEEPNRLTKAAQINIRLGTAYLERKEILRAKQKFLLALDEAPSLPEAWYAMAYFYETTANNELAREHFLKALALAPNRGDVQNNYGTFLCRTGNYNEAIKYFLSAVRDKEYLDSSSAYENAGLCALKMPNKKLAIEYFTKSVEEDPTRASALLELADLYYQQGNYQLANFQLIQFHQINGATPRSTGLAEKIKAHT